MTPEETDKQAIETIKGTSKYILMAEHSEGSCQILAKNMPKNEILIYIASLLCNLENVENTQAQK